MSFPSPCSSKPLWRWSVITVSFYNIAVLSKRKNNNPDHITLYCTMDPTETPTGHKTVIWISHTPFSSSLFNVVCIWLHAKIILSSSYEGELQSQLNAYPFKRPVRDLKHRRRATEETVLPIGHIEPLHFKEKSNFAAVLYISTEPEFSQFGSLSL